MNRRILDSVQVWEGDGVVYSSESGDVLGGRTIASDLLCDFTNIETAEKSPAPTFDHTLARLRVILV